jgi:hypothetical protein
MSTTPGRADLGSISGVALAGWPMFALGSQQSVGVDATLRPLPGWADEKGQEGFTLFIARPLESVYGSAGCADSQLRVRRSEPRLRVVVGQMPLLL